MNVESGEGIESTTCRIQNDEVAVAVRWNPVKELKDHVVAVARV